ncbi:hypothetical protein K0M31_010488 [Melipona bicolor]|uniref:Uncharacterized protein n=1 Tax=Melipona bicolor TaxID=60889 RepID=A0AA40FLY4_9HYME|nr:hypothetical protein K0M31_010488 [Melipona bicolor]
MGNISVIFNLKGLRFGMHDGRANEIWGSECEREESCSVLLFVSKSLINRADDSSDSFTPDACCCNYSLGWTVTHPSGVPHTVLLNVGDRQDLDARRAASCDLC